MANCIVYRDIPPCEPGLVDRLKGFSVADLHESQSSTRRANSLMSPNMRPVGHGLRIVGQAVTAVGEPGDNLMLYAALDVIQPGQVLVMTNGGAASGALFGDVSASFALKIGAAGIVVDGPVRDASTLRGMSCPVWSTLISPTHPEKRGPCSVNVPISCAGCVINPGDIVVADDDAVLVLRPDELETVLETAQIRQSREKEYRKRISAGDHICDVLGMRELLHAAGIEYHANSHIEHGCGHPKLF